MNPSEFASYAARDPLVEQWLPYDEAVAAVRKTRKQVSIMVGTFARVTTDPKHRGTNTPGCLVRLTKAQALKFLDDAFPKHWRPKLSVRVSVSKHCMFIGSSPA